MAKVSALDGSIKDSENEVTVYNTMIGTNILNMHYYLNCLYLFFIFINI